MRPTLVILLVAADGPTSKSPPGGLARLHARRAGSFGARPRAKAPVRLPSSWSGTGQTFAAAGAQFRSRETAAFVFAV
jgi:hypothetical protein